jgi:hypothetical protein
VGWIYSNKLVGEQVPHNARGFLIAFAAVTVGICSLGEIAYRAWLYRTYVVNAAYGVFTIDYRIPSLLHFVEPNNVLGPHPLGVRFMLRQYAVDGSFVRASHVNTNNLGWVSPYDYVLPKPSGEFRIAILGDSLTASINNDVPWPSVVQYELRKSIPQASVMNLGNPGMSAQWMERLMLPIAQKLSADTVVANIIVESLDFPLIAKNEPLDSVFGALPTVLIEDVEVPFVCSGTGARACSIASLWYVSPGRELSQSEVNDVKRTAAWLVLRNRLLFRPKSFLFSPQGVMQHAPTAGADERIAAAIDALLAIKQAYPNLIVTINPLEWYYDPNTLPQNAAKFITRAKAAGIDIIDMRERLPQVTAEERHLWWNMPHDGHWSDQGAEIYGRAMAQLLKERFVAITEIAKTSPGGSGR